MNNYLRAKLFIIILNTKLFRKNINNNKKNKGDNNNWFIYNIRKIVFFSAHSLYIILMKSLFFYKKGNKH